VLLAVALAAAGQPESAAAWDPLAEPRERAGLRPLPTRFALPGGELRVTPTEFLASTGRTLTFAVVLDEGAAGGTLAVRLPALWLRKAPGGLPYTRAPELRRGAARLGRRGADLTLALAPGEREAAFTLEDVGVPAGTHEISATWRARGGASTTLETVRVRAFAPELESAGAEGAGPAPPSWSRLPNPAEEINATSDAIEESETFVAVTPGDADHVAISANTVEAASVSAWTTNTGRPPFARTDMPQNVDVPGLGSDQLLPICCDPTIATDRLGNVWVGALAGSNGTSPTRRSSTASPRARPASAGARPACRFGPRATRTSR